MNEELWASKNFGLRFCTCGATHSIPPHLRKAKKASNWTGVVQPIVPISTQCEIEEHRRNRIQRKLQQSDFNEAALELGYKIGEGAFGVVYEGLYMGSRKVAVKQMRIDNIDSSLINDFHRETDFMRGLNHMNIVQLLGVVENYPRLLMVTELLENGSIWEMYHDGLHDHIMKGALVFLNGSQSRFI